MLWGALAFAAGITTGVHAWRPPLWWVVAWIVFTLSGAYLLRRRSRAAFIIGLGALFFLGALVVQVRGSNDANQSDAPQFAGGTEVTVTAHVTKEGTLQQDDGPGSFRQRIEVETEQIAQGDENFAVKSGLRVNVYQQPLKDQADEAGAAPVHLFTYGERLRFLAKISAPRNYRNPGASDYRGYLSENGIAALASTNAASVETLPGFAGSRAELWRSRIHRSIIEKVHALWPARQAALMDAMVIGEDAFINRPTRADFQRSGTYHVLVVSGMNVSILALVTFWFLRRMRVSDFVAGAMTVSLMVAYAVITGLGAPVWRATSMLALYLGTRLIYREKSMLNAIGAAALGLMIVNPQVLFGASFQLTFLCVWLVAAVGIPILERTTQPFVRGTRHINLTSYDFVLPAPVVQFRLDLRMIAGRLQRFAGRMPLPALAIGSRTLLTRGRAAADFSGHADRAGASDGLLLPSRHGCGIAGQYAGCALDGTADAGGRFGHGVGIHLGHPGKGSRADSRRCARRHCRHGTLAGRTAGR